MASKAKEPMSPLAHDIAAGLEEYAAYKRGEKTDIIVYIFPKFPEELDRNYNSTLDC
jgi:hypothetical protein